MADTFFIRFNPAGLFSPLQLQFSALARLIFPLAIVLLAFLFRSKIGDLSSEVRVLVNNLPYTACILAIFMAHQFRQCRMLLAAIAVGFLYWLIRTQLQVSLSQPGARDAYLGASACLPVLGLFLLLVPERGVWNVYGLVNTAIFFSLACACYFAPHWLPALGVELSSPGALVPAQSYILSLPATIVLIVVFVLALLLLCIRNTDTEAALIGVMVACYITLAYLQLEFISVAMCAAAGVCLVYGLMRSSHAMAYRDDLTGLLGRRAFNERIKSLGRVYSIAMVDVDHFKKFNDKFGHDVGDQVLRLVASRLKRVPGGTAYRYGGEEFAIVFPRRWVDQCIGDLDQLRKSIADYQMSLRDTKLRPKKSAKGSVKRGATRVACGHVSITVSIGVAEREDESMDATGVLKAADAQLYRAKRAGRNRIKS